jgi:hypothetical protein
VHVLAGPDSDAFVKLESGLDQRATLIWANPGFGAAGSEFKMFNDGAQQTYPTLRISDGDENVMLSIFDIGELGNIHVTGNGLFGGPDAIGLRTLTVQSTDEAQMNVIAAGASEAVLQITSGPDQRSILILMDPSDTDPSEFHILNDGTQFLPTMRITDGTNEMLKIQDKGTTGDLIVSGNGQFGAFLSSPSRPAAALFYPTPHTHHRHAIFKARVILRLR